MTAQQEEFKKIIQEAEQKYPATLRNKANVASLFAKIIQVNYCKGHTTEAMLEALSGTLMYFSCDEYRRHLIFQNLLSMLTSRSHHEKILAHALIGKIERVKDDLKMEHMSDKLVSQSNSPLMEFTGGVAALSLVVDKVVAQKDIEINFPWSLSNKEILECIRNDEAFFSLAQYLKLAGGIVGGKGLIKIIIGRIKEGKFSRWGVVIFILSLIFILLAREESRSETSLKKESGYRNLWAKD